MYKSHWKAWFVFSKSDRRAIIMLLSIIALTVLTPYLLPEKKLEIHIDKELQAELDAYRRDNSQQQNNLPFTAGYRDTTVKDTIKPALFYFDPNTLSEEGFVQLGLSPKTAHTLINYRNKGGYFRKPEDIRKIYSLSKTDADRLIPYIRIAAKNYKETTNEKPAPPSVTDQYKKININTATAEEWKAFPGIGDVLANRIVKFRNSMGGFKSVDQVSKTYGLSDSVYQAIKPYLYLEGTATNNQ